MRLRARDQRRRTATASNEVRGVTGSTAVLVDVGADHNFLLDPPTGKSSLTVQFVDEHFVDSYYPTIENTFQKLVKHKGQEYQLDIIDTAGQVRSFTRSTFSRDSS